MAAAEQTSGSNAHIRERRRTFDQRKSDGGFRVRLFQRDADTGENGDLIRAMKRYESGRIQDPFDGHYGQGGGALHVIEPPYYLTRLLGIPHENNTLRQCIDAYVTNIEGFGYRLEYVGEDGREDSPEAVAEWNRLASLLDQPNGEYTLIELRERRRRDLESTGNGYFEVARDATGEITMLHHLPAHTIRLTRKDDVGTPIERIVTRNGVPTRIRTRRRFRRYVQTVGSQKVYFKEFGDPRAIDPKTGLEAPGLSIEEQATEVFCSAIYAPGHAYGLPRWINQLPAILGSREAEMTNLQFFKDNAIPAMAVLVAGGLLSANSASDIEEHFTKGRGRDAMNRVLVIEAQSTGNAIGPDGKSAAPRIDIKPLAAERQGDALFQQYDKNNMGKVRSSFRLPPIFIGYSDDYTRATAEASMIMAEGQVFGPERNKVDDEFNMHLLADRNGEPPKYWRFRSLPPRLVAPDSIVSAITTLDGLGAMTPNIAIGITNELFDLNIQSIEEEWGDYPFELVNTMLARGISLSSLSELQNAVTQLEGQLAGEAADVASADAEEPVVDEATGNVVEDEKKRFARRVAARKRKMVARKRAVLAPLQRIARHGVDGDETGFKAA